MKTNHVSRLVSAMGFSLPWLESRHLRVSPMLVYLSPATDTHLGLHTSSTRELDEKQEQESRDWGSTLELDKKQMEK